MRACPWCGRSLPDIAAYCSGCGRPMPRPVQAQGRGTSRAVIVGVVAAVLIAGTCMAGIIASIAIPNLLSAIQRAKQKRAVGEVRSVAMAVQAYRTDHRSCPVPEPGGASWRFVPLDSLKSALEPEYAAHLPASDPWENAYLYGFAPDGSSFCILSAGKNRTRERETLPAAPVTTHCFESDIIWVDDGFVQRPDGRQHACAGAVE